MRAYKNAMSVRKIVIWGAPLNSIRDVMVLPADRDMRRHEQTETVDLRTVGKTSRTKQKQVNEPFFFAWLEDWFRLL